MNRRLKMHMIGNAHIDPVWLWKWHEGYAEVKATFRSALDRMKEFPDFIFTCACAAYYKWIEENDPGMFHEIKERIREGRWRLAGGMWIQPDCNIPSGESFARHILYSQRYFMDKFGEISRVGYNVDSFGHNRMLPQILKKGGMDYYIFFRPGDHEKELPGNVFWWESEDGSRVLAFKIPYGYANAGKGDLSKKMLGVKQLAREQGIDFMYFYGVGNHGGGPTIDNINAIYRVMEQEKDTEFVFSSPEQYFDSLGEQTGSLPVIKEDLQHHASGCYSANWEVKANNRKAEHRLISAEKFSAIAYILLDYPYRGAEIQAAWEKVMFNQFHDILGGCSIKEAYDDARDWHGWALHTADWVQNGAIQKMSWAIDTMKGSIRYLSKEKHKRLWEIDDNGIPFVVFNPLSWEVKAPVQVGNPVKGVTDDKGNPVLSQIVRGSRTNRDDKWDTLFEVCIPAMGYRVYWMYVDKEFAVCNDAKCLNACDNVIENSHIRLEIEKHTGYIKSLHDKRNNAEVLHGAGAVPVVIDIHHCDTWAHGVFEFSKEIGRFADAHVELMENGPVRSMLRVTSRYNNSVLRQDFIVYNDRPEVEVEVKLDWREKHKMLKLSFPVNIKEPSATYEIPYGFIIRPANGEEEPGQQWVDISGKLEGMDYGLTLINDSKYSFSIKGNDMRMTVANSSFFSEQHGERDKWCEYMDQGIQKFRYLLVPHPGGWQEANAVKRAYEFNVKPVGIAETYHHGVLPSIMEGIRISSNNIIAAVFKRAEEDDGFILRCYETSGRAEKATISISILNREWNAEFNKCEIKTYWIPDNPDDEVVERNLLEK
jgi:alpha-mannosidase